MTLFYRSALLRITDAEFRLGTTAGESLAISELHGVSPGRGETLTHGASLRSYSARLAGPAAVAALIGGPALGNPALSVVALGALLATSAVWATLRAKWARPYQLWATYRGERLCLFETRDRLTYGQVERALRRALERHDGAG